MRNSETTSNRKLTKSISSSKETRIPLQLSSYVVNKAVIGISGGLWRCVTAPVVMFLIGSKLQQAGVAVSVVWSPEKGHEGGKQWLPILAEREEEGDRRRRVAGFLRQQQCTRNR